MSQRLKNFLAKSVLREIGIAVGVSEDAIRDPPRAAQGRGQACSFHTSRLSVMVR
jgi:hypothetical protein